MIEGTLTVAVSEPANVFMLEELERLSGHPVQLVAATVRDIKATLQTYLPNDKVFVIDDIIEEVKPEEFTLIESAKIEDIANLEAAAGDSPVVKFVNYCIYNAVKEGASDIHIEPGDNILRVRYRIDGRLAERLARLSDAWRGDEPHQDHGRPGHLRKPPAQDGVRLGTHELSPNSLDLFLLHKTTVLHVLFHNLLILWTLWFVLCFVSNMQLELI